MEVGKEEEGRLILTEDQCTVRTLSLLSVEEVEEVEFHRGRGRVERRYGEVGVS